LTGFFKEALPSNLQKIPRKVVAVCKNSPKKSWLNKSRIPNKKLSTKKTLIQKRRNEKKLMKGRRNYTYLYIL
jgi:hypothetical protein